MAGKKRDEAGKAARLGVWISILITFTPTIRAADVKGNAPAQATAEHGYALLFDLLGDEQNLSKLLIIKRDRPELKKLVKAISESAGKAHKELEKLGKHGEINLKEHGLPDAEVQTRKSISQEKAKTLLAEKGDDFEFALLLTQNEALTYGAHLAGVLAAGESQSERIRFLQRLSSDLTHLRQEVTRMLREHRNP
jgi:hypothetical protein